jgi:DnaK suppressor protein
MDQARERLQREFDQVAGKLRQLGIALEGDEQARPDSQAVNDIGDVAQVSERRDFEFATRERLAQRLARLTDALRRLDEGSYGVCEHCGREIQPARLQAIPESSLCRDCQEQVEREAGTARPASL